MSVLSLKYFDDSNLRKKSLPIESINDDIKQLALDMIDSMLHYNGVGLAAPQVGRLVRLIVIRDEFVGEDEEYKLGPPEVLINPVLSNPSRETETMSEGCLSIPGIHADVVRPASIHVRYQTLDGRIVEESPVGFRARVIMHENDHLNGVLYIDRVSPEDRKRIDPMLRSIDEKFHP
ncbi:MAG: def-B [Parachlamydiales bacterium]|nr:def-B [Parachlamydiales bacterium]